MSAFAIVLGCLAYCVVWVVFGAVVYAMDGSEESKSIGFALGLGWPFMLPLAIIYFGIPALGRIFARWVPAKPKPTKPNDGRPSDPSEIL